MTDFATAQQEDRRLKILEALAGQTDETLSDSLIHRYLKITAHNVTIDVVRRDLRWLSEVGAISLIDHPVFIATLMDTGRSHIARETIIDGVERARRRQ